MSRILSMTALAVGALLAFPAIAVAGPPWVAIELPANPLDPTTRGALFVVHSYHHGTPVPSPVACTAEGLVDGQRRSAALTVNTTSRPGVSAVRGTVPGEGTWMVVCVSRDEHARATVLLDFEGNGEITRVRVPHRSAEGGRWSIPTDVSARDIDAMLRQRARQAAGPGVLAGLLLLALAPVGWVLRRG